MHTDERNAAAATIAELITLLQAHPEAATAAIVGECEALARAVAAFHLEGIRFRMYNVDRLVTGAGGTLSPQAAHLLEQARRHLEAAGFHTRSHQAPS